MPTMNGFTKKQLKLADRLLRLAYANEDHVRQDLGSLLSDLEIESIMSYPIAEAHGEADLYLPRRRVVIETKRRRFADNPERPQEGRPNNESPREQLERYVFGEMERESQLLALDGPSDREWTGILTDGCVWHVWRYEHGSKRDSGRRMERSTVPGSACQLLDLLDHYVSGEPIGKPWIPADPVELFTPFFSSLRDIYESLEGRVLTETGTKRRLWLDLLRTANMEPANQAAQGRLFVSHSFLVVLARCVVASLGSPGRRPDVEPLCNEGFVAWIPGTHAGRVWAENFMDAVHSYEWRLRPGDVLRPLYEAFVEEKDRKAFGEFYTPDWLAELLVHEILDDDWLQTAIDAAAVAVQNGKEQLKGIGVLDPACGSGTFLYHAARRLAGARRFKGNDRYVWQADIITRLVNGVDVHPVAAEMSRATLRRALPGEPSDGPGALRIYEGDSLLVANAVETRSGLQLEGRDLRITSEKGGDAVVPAFLLERPTFARDLRELIAAAAGGEPLPLWLRRSARKKHELQALEKCRASFGKIIAEEGNSVWCWYIVNTTGPRLLSERKVDRIVANPPWVAMAEVQAEGRKRALERFAKHLDLWTGGRDAPHFDIAQLFVRRARELYLAKPNRNPAAWIVKKAALRAGGWRKFREWHRAICAQTLDLETVQPFGGGDARRCCVLFNCRPSSLGPEPALEAVPKGQERPKPHMTAEEAQVLLDIRAAPAVLPQGVSDYVDDTPQNRPLFRQGATITPKVLVVLNLVRAGSLPGTREVVTTQSVKHRWNSLAVQTGEVPEHWVHSLLTSGELLPFACAQKLPKALVPTDENDRLEQAPKNEFWAGLEQLWKEYRGKGHNTPKTLLRRLNYGEALARQLGLRGRGRTLVLHPRSGDIMRGARVKPGLTIMDSTVYYANMSNAAEAAYLVSILNAPALKRAFALSRTSGRDFHQNPWRSIPIPYYNPNDETHRRLFHLCKRAEEIAEDWLRNAPGQHGQVAASKRIRERLIEERVFDRIDEAVRRILPDHAEGA